jgi:hypothetical protein
MVHHMNPSNWFRTGGALIDPQRLGCLPIIARWAVWFGILAMICGLYSCAHACEKPYHKPTWCELHRCV